MRRRALWLARAEENQSKFKGTHKGEPGMISLNAQHREQTELVRTPWQRSTLVTSVFRYGFIEAVVSAIHWPLDTKPTASPKASCVAVSGRVSAGTTEGSHSTMRKLFRSPRKTPTCRRATAPWH